MSFPTRLQIKTAVQSELPYSMNLDVAIQELVERSYEAGVCPNSREEIEVDLSAERTTWSEYEVIMFDPEDYDSMLRARDNEKPNSVVSWEVMDVDAEHQTPGSTELRFVDHGEKDIGGGVMRRIYQLPSELRESDEIIRCLMRHHAPVIDEDSDEVPFKNIYLVKLGLLAIGYENEADARAEKAWQTYYSQSGLSQRRADGVKRCFIKIDHGLRRHPTNFL